MVTYARLFAACGIDWASACERAMRFEPVIAQVDADLMAELHGMAQGSGQSLGSLMALEAVKFLTGAGESLRGRLMLFDGLHGENRSITLRKRADCSVCGQGHATGWTAPAASP